MARTIYQNNDVRIELERVDEYEIKVNCNGENIIWISKGDEDIFQKELTELFDKYRI